MNSTYNLYYFKINVYNSVIECDVFIAVQYIFKPLICKYRIHANNLNMETDRFLEICNCCNDMCISE